MPVRIQTTLLRIQRLSQYPSGVIYRTLIDRIQLLSSSGLLCVSYLSWDIPIREGDSGHSPPIFKLSSDELKNEFSYDQNNFWAITNRVYHDTIRRMSRLSTDLSLILCGGD